MTQENKKIFVEYAFTGKYSSEDALELLDCEEKLMEDSVITNVADDIYKIGRQYYLFSQLLNDYDGSKTINLKYYLEQLQKEMEHQYIRKNQIENRTGYLIALWSIITIFVMEKMVIDSGIRCDTCIKLGSLICLIVVGIISLVFMMNIMLSKQINFYISKSKWNDYYSAMEHQEMAIVRLIEGNKNSFEENEKLLNKMGTRLNWSVILEMIYLIFIIINIVVQR